MIPAPVKNAGFQFIDLSKLISMSLLLLSLVSIVLLVTKGRSSFESLNKETAITTGRKRINTANDPAGNHSGSPAVLVKLVIASKAPHPATR